MGRADGSQVTEDQMKALFGEGLHPNADRITAHLSGVGVAGAGAVAAARLGRPFRHQRQRNRVHHPAAGGLPRLQHHTRRRPPAPHLPPRSGPGIRTALGLEMFTETYARPPADDRELSGFIARNSRAATTAVAGYDLTFTPVKSVSDPVGDRPATDRRT